MADTRCKHCGERIFQEWPGVWLHVKRTRKQCASNPFRAATPEEAGRG